MEPGMLMSVKTRSSPCVSQNPDRLIGVVSGENLVARFPKFTACEHVDKGFVLDHDSNATLGVRRSLAPGPMRYRARCSISCNGPTQLLANHSRLVVVHTDFGFGRRQKTQLSGDFYMKARRCVGRLAGGIASGAC